MRVHVNTPNARPMNDVVLDAFKRFNCEPLGGPSTNGWSRLADLQRCPYRYYLQHEVGAVAIDALDGNLVAPAPSLEIGGLLHVCLALHYGRRLPKGYPGWRENMPSPFDFLQACDELGAEIARIEEVRRLYYGYSEFYGPEEDIQPLAVEYGAGIPEVHTCRFDTLIWKDGAIWNLEHKTAMAETADVLESWWLDGEIIGQSYAWQLSDLTKVFGHPMAGTIINLCFKHRPPKYRRLEIVIPQKVIDTYVQDRAFWAMQKARFKQAGHWPRSLAGCVSRYNRCSFWSHCRDVDNSCLEIRPRE